MMYIRSQLIPVAWDCGDVLLETVEVDVCIVFRTRLEMSTSTLS
jgi:hypothetical protein